MATDIYHPVFSLTAKQHNRYLFKVFILLGSFFPVHGLALSSLSISIDKVDANQVKLEQVSVNLQQLNTDQAVVDVSLEKAKSKELAKLDMRKLHLQCNGLISNEKTVACEVANLSVSSEWLKAKQSVLNWVYRFDQNQLDFLIKNVQVFSGKTRIKGQLHNQILNAEIKINSGKLSAAQFNDFGLSLPENTLLEGRLSGDFSLLRTPDRLAIAYDAKLNDLAFTDENGAYLADAVNAHVKGKYRLTDSGHYLEGLSMKLESGEMLSPFFYTNLTDRPLALSLDRLALDVNADSSLLWSLEQVSLKDKELDLRFNKMSGNSGNIHKGDIQLNDATLENIYAYYFLPILSNDLAQMTVSGEVNAHLNFDEGKLVNYDIELLEGNFVHQPQTDKKKFDIQGLNVEVSANSKTNKSSYLSFEKGTLLETIHFGKTSFPLLADFSSVRLQEDVTMPVFDGGIIIEQFEIANFNVSPSVKFQGVITPISLSQVTEALEWPVMTGKISGIVPAVEYHDGNAQFAGTLLVRAFDGNILVKNLEASHLLSAWPVLHADLEFKEIDLEKLTETFEFGRITGLLDGRFDHLQLENWQPTQFDARFVTSEKTSKKRISQKAVDNISNLGGAGVAGALSRSFMRFFEDFGYDKIGFTCLLRDNVCKMSGVEDAETGYYLVKGGGIPRIDVIGHNRNIDWNILVSRLVNITSSGSPTIQ